MARLILCLLLALAVLLPTNVLAHEGEWIMVSSRGLSLKGDTLTGTLHLGDDILLAFGATRAAPQYWQVYDATANQFELNSTDCDGGGTDCLPLRIPDGGNDVIFSGRIWSQSDTEGVDLGAGGASGDSSLYYDGTDQHEAIAAGGKIVCLNGQACALDPDRDAFHIIRGSAGTVQAPSAADFIIEDTTTAVAALLSPDAQTSSLQFGSPNDSAEAWVQYYNSAASPASTLVLGANNANQVFIGAGTWAYQVATTVSTTSTNDLTLAPGGSLVMPLGATLPATCTQGAYFHDTDSDDCADTGGGDGALCLCKTTNTWVLISNF
jgi:hypothetical protein